MSRHISSLHYPLPNCFHICAGKSWWLHARYIQTPGKYPPILWILYPSSGVVHFTPLYTYFRWMEDQRMKDISYFSLLLVGITLPSVKSLCSHCEEKTYDIFLRMLEAQMKPGSLWHQGRQFRATHNSIHVTGPEATKMMLLWALLYTGRPFTGSLLKQHLNAQGAAHSKAPRVRLCPLACSVYYLALRTLSIRSWWMHRWFSIFLKHVISLPFNFRPIPFQNFLTSSLYYRRRMRSLG